MTRQKRFLLLLKQESSKQSALMDVKGGLWVAFSFG